MLGRTAARLRAFVRDRPLTGFFALAFLWSWAWWALMLFAIWQGALRSGAPGWGGVPYWMIGVALLGGWGPTLAALAVTAARDGRGGVSALLRRCLIWRVAAGWHLAAWLLPPALMAGGLLIYQGLGNAPGPFDPHRWRLALLALAVSLPAGPLGEELGWRGFALPRLEPALGALGASLVIGVLWWAWHAPLFWAPVGATPSGAPVTVWAAGKYLAYVVGLSVVFTWLFNGAGRSLLIVIVLHLTVNADLVTLFFPQLHASGVRTVRELSAIPLWAVAVALIAVCGPARPSRRRS